MRRTGSTDGKALRKTGFTKRKNMHRFGWMGHLIRVILLLGGVLLLTGRAGILLSICSGSMEPALPVGSLIYVRGCDLSEVKEGDVISFFLPDGVTKVTHRVTRTDGHVLYTKGDANREEDPGTVTADRLIGRVRFCIPFLGYIPVCLERILGGG